MADPKVKISIEVDKPKAQKAKKEINELSRWFKDFTVKVTKSKFAVGTMFAALSFSVLKAIKDFAELDKKITNVVNLFGGTRDDVKAFTEDIINLSTRVPQSMDDLALALFDVKSAGVETGQSMKFLEEAANLATAGVTNTKTAANGMIGVMNAWGIETRNASDISDLFFKTQVHGVTTIEQLANHMGTLLPIAKQAGLTLEETFASVATLSKGSISTAESVTAMKGALMALIKQQEKAKELSDKYSISLELGGKSGRTFADLLREIEELAKTGNAEFADFIPRARGLIGVLSLSGERTKELEELTSLLGERYGSTAKALTLMQETSSNQYSILLGNLKKLSIETVSIFDPLLKVSAKAVNALFKGYQEMQEGVVARNKETLKSFSDKELIKIVEENNKKLLELRKIYDNARNRDVKLRTVNEYNQIKLENQRILQLQKEYLEKASIEKQKQVEEDAEKEQLALIKYNKDIQAFMDSFSDDRKTTRAKELKEKQRIWSEEQEGMLKHMMALKEAQENALNLMMDVGASFIDENGLNMEEGLLNTTKNIIDSFKLEIAKGLSGVMGETMAGFATGVLGDVVLNGVTSILTSIFGSKPIKTTAEYAEDAFDKMVKKTNRVISDLGKKKEGKEKEIDLIENLADTFGGETKISDLSEKGLISKELIATLATFTSKDETLNQAVDRLISTIIDINLDSKKSIEKIISKAGTDRRNLEISKNYMSQLKYTQYSTDTILESISKALGKDNGSLEVIGTYNNLNIDKDVYSKQEISNLFGGAIQGSVDLMTENMTKLNGLTDTIYEYAEDELDLVKFRQDVEEKKINEDNKPDPLEDNEPDPLEDNAQELFDKEIEKERNNLLELETKRDLVAQDRIDSINRLLDSELATEESKKKLNRDLLIQQAKQREEREAIADKDLSLEEKKQKKINDTMDFLEDAGFDLQDLLRDRERDIRDAELKYDPINYSTELGAKKALIEQGFADKLEDLAIDFDRDKAKEPLTININAGAFMGTPADARNFARMIDDELFKLGRTGQSISNQ